MKRDDLIARARCSIGHGTLYRLGTGAPPTASKPWDELGSCDCSGFVCWVLGISRYQHIFSFLRALNGGWMNTDGMVCDSLHPTGLFEPTSDPLPGDVVVYPSIVYARKIFKHLRPFGSYTPRIGHAGILTGDDKVIHCSASNYTKAADAIQETCLDPFLAVRYTRYVRFCALE